MNKYLIRFNTKHNGSELVWRVFENGVEHLVKNISIRVPVFTETSLEAGETKWNISCVGEMRIVDDVAYIVEKIDNKLEDLMYSAGLTAQGCWDQLDSYDKEAIQKYADLIVEECCRKLLDMDEKTRGNHNYYKHAALEIKKHFKKPAETVENLGALDQYDDPIWQGKQFRSLGKPGIN